MKVGILGAGAIGMPLGYMLRNKEKNEVVYLVRQKRVDEMKGTTVKLFNYDKKKLVEMPLGESNLLPTEPLTSDTISELNPYKDFDVVIITLPTDVLEGDIGRTIMNGLSLRVKAECMFLCLSPGFGIQERVFGPAGITAPRVFYGLPLFLSHEVGMEGQPEKPKFAARKEASLAFHYLLSSGRIMLLSRRPKVMKKTLSAARSGSIPSGTKVLEASTVLFLMINLLLNLQDYPTSMKKSDPKFKTGMKAWHQIMNQYGGLGTLFNLFVGGNMMKITDYFNRKMTKPLTMDFIKHHHGNKVLQQNVDVVKAYIETGRARGKKVDKIEEFVALFPQSHSE